jgi:hypothetical protein
MEKIKDPAFLLSTIDAIGLVGATYYFYKQNESMREDMKKMSQSIAGILKKVSELDKNTQQHAEALRAINEQIKPINEQMKQFSQTVEDVSCMDEELEFITVALGKHNILEEDIKRINQYKPRDSRVTPQPVQGYREVEYDKYVRSRDPDYEKSSRSRNRFHERSDRGTYPSEQMNPGRPVYTNPARQSYPAEQHQTKIPEFSDDSDLIADVRRQQEEK